MDASWEWRKEIAVRGRADAATKAAAVACVIGLLEAHPPLWRLFGERWRQPEYYSLVMQPFILSPAINVGDIAVQMAAQPGLSPDEAIRAAHPFPILERLVAAEIRDPGGSGAVAVKPGTQVIIFTADLAAACWPPFGVGPRACAGTALALGLLRPMHASLRTLPAFQPAVGHRFSGRNNDGNVSWREALYFVKTIVPVLLFADPRSAVGQPHSAVQCGGAAEQRP